VKAKTGKLGEDLAARFLLEKGYTIRERNYRWRGGEIDIIATEGKTLVFIEVKTSRTTNFGAPELWVDERKQHRIAITAEKYLYSRRFDGMECRFDVIAVTLSKESSEIRHIEDAFWLS
jgi:putative endonuclease